MEWAPPHRESLTWHLRADWFDYPIVEIQVSHRLQVPQNGRFPEQEWEQVVIS